MKRKFMSILIVIIILVCLGFTFGFRYLKSPALLEWDYNQKISEVTILMDDPDDPDMVRLRTEYKLEEVVRGTESNYEKLKKIIKWTHGQWEHSGSNRPSRSDPLTILKEASEGERFRCVENGIVVAASARALGMPSRVLCLKRKDVETARSNAGHVVAEVWLDQFDKWVFVDAQFDVIPEVDGVPLNAIELQDAIARNKSGLVIRSSSSGKFQKYCYIKWIGLYLYYFDFSIDQRFFLEKSEKRQGKVMLVPKGAKNPKVFQRKYPIENCTYISNPEAFYPLIEE
ncbi:transglutaminase domain-containing protein [candidate division WOR-3 bacterium]|nr:transglutaminase domain-containing protein [candidate division WOR-3 bacterium]